MFLTVSIVVVCNHSRAKPKNPLKLKLVAVVV